MKDTFITFVLVALAIVCMCAGFILIIAECDDFCMLAVTKVAGFVCWMFTYAFVSATGYISDLKDLEDLDEM